MQSIDSLTRKIADREQDRLLLCRDLEEIEHIRAELFTRIAHGGGGDGSATTPIIINLIERLAIFLVQTERFAELEIRLGCQLERAKQRKRGEGVEQMAKHIQEQCVSSRGWIVRDQQKGIHSHILLYRCIGY